MSTLLERFWSHVPPVRAPDPLICAEYTGTINKKGYGQISDGRRRTVLAHRLIYELIVGPIPEGHDVCHRCDNPPCVNEHHLFTGTKLQNQQDKKQKGRSAKGEGNGGGGKLTEGEVSAIRERALAGPVNKTALGREFGVSRTMIRFILERKQWDHI